MGLAPEVEEVAGLTPPPVDLDARVVWFPVRHHSPACARHVDRLVRELRPEAVLVEGPRDATSLIPFLTHAETRPPVAIYATYVRRRKGTVPERFAAYYPLCDTSPELAALRAAAEIGARARFIDLSFPEQVTAEASAEPGTPRSLQSEGHFSHGRLLRAACRRTGSRDPDDLWDHLYEVGGTDDVAEFMRGVLLYCALARHEARPEELEAEGCLARERAMAAAVAAEKGRVVVVTGGFHSVALPTTEPGPPPKVRAKPKDAQVVLMRYGFEQLDRLNGYASGMPSPGFYQRLWEGGDVTGILVEAGRALRERGLAISTADVIAATHHARGLAALRGHLRPSREDLLDGVRSVFVKGAEDIEGVPVLAIVRKQLAGDRTGEIPATAGQPPIVDDFRRVAAELRLDLERTELRATTLDLYRSRSHRARSRFFHRVRFLGVPFAEFVRGPDFVEGSDLERVQEVWRYGWSPPTEASLIELSLYGASIEEAATARLSETFEAAAQRGQANRADVATRSLLEACRMGLHAEAAALLERSAPVVARDVAFDSLVAATEQLLALHHSREPLEAHHLEGVPELARTAWRRACYVLPELGAITENEDAMLDAINALLETAATLGDDDAERTLRHGALRRLAADPEANPVLHGGALGALHAEGQCSAAELVAALDGRLQGARIGAPAGAAFLRGLLRCARSVLWAVPECVARLHELLRELDEDAFVTLVPHLRLALADLTPRETDRVAAVVAEVAGVAKIAPLHLGEISAEERLRGEAIDRMVREVLARDGLEERDA